MSNKNITSRAALVAISAHLIVGLAACGPDDPAQNNTSSNNMTSNNSTENSMMNNMENGTPNGTPNNSMENNMANGNPNGMANNMENGNPNGDPNNSMENNMANGTPNGAPNNTSNGNPNGTSNNMANGTPNGMSNNMANGNPNGTPNNMMDKCADVTCDDTGVRCDGNIVKDNGDAGMCDAETGMCTYPNAAADINCEDSGQICMDGACVDVVMAAAPAPGDLSITEVLYDPDANMVSDDFGEWVEIYNNTDQAITLRGSKLKDDANEHEITTDVIVPANSYFVLGVSDDKMTNGDVDVDYVWTGFKLSNAGDIFTIENAAGEIVTTVDYGADGFPGDKGKAIQFNGDLDLAADYDSADAAKWCVAPDQWSMTSDFGSPGAANPGCAPPPVGTEHTIYELSDEAHMNHPAQDTAVIIKGAVVTAFGLDGNGEPHAWVQDPQGGEHSGIYLDIDSTTAPMMGAVTVGLTTVDVEGIYNERFDLARVEVSKITITGTAAAEVLPTPVSTATLADAAEAEKWENVLVELNGVGVTNENPDGPNNDYGEFTLNNVVRADDLLFALPMGMDAKDCDVFSKIAGPLNYSFGNFKVEPRSADDVTLEWSGMVASSVTSNFDGTQFTPKYGCTYKNGKYTLGNTSAGDVSIFERDELSGMPVMGAQIGGTLATMTDTGELTPAGPGVVNFVAQTAGLEAGAIVVIDKNDPSVMMSSGVNPGDLVITEIMKDSSAVGDSDGEWFEVYNTTAADIDVDGFTIKDDGGDSHIINNGGMPVIIPAGGYALFAKNADAMNNGGLPTNVTVYEYSNINMSNSADEVVLVDTANVEIDRVNYLNGMGWPDTSGIALNLSDDKKTATDNDDMMNWCDATMTFGAGDAGTPGAANTVCTPAP